MDAMLILGGVAVELHARLCVSGSGLASCP
jgi:hypothetical protein